jgi:hypothetical protein
MEYGCKEDIVFATTLVMSAIVSKVCQIEDSNMFVQ